MIKTINGNILNATENIICQQVNCMSVMGAGLAKQIINKYPEVHPSYKRFCKGCKDNDNRNLLGSIQTIPTADGKVIANLFSQYDYGRDKQHTDYNALRECFRSLLKVSEMFDDSIAIPYGIGCGLAGGDWYVVSNIIEEVFGQYYNVTVYRLK